MVLISKSLIHTCSFEYARERMSSIFNNTKVGKIKCFQGVHAKSLAKPQCAFHPLHDLNTHHLKNIKTNGPIILSKKCNHCDHLLKNWVPGEFSFWNFSTHWPGNIGRPGHNLHTGYMIIIIKLNQNIGIYTSMRSKILHFMVQRLISLFGEVMTLQDDWKIMMIAIL